MYRINYLKLDERKGYFKGRVIIQNESHQECGKWKLRFRFLNGQKLKLMNFYSWEESDGVVTIIPKYCWEIGKLKSLAIDFLAQYDEDKINEDPVGFEIVEDEVIQGEINIFVEPPMFCDNNFQPVISIDDKKIPMNWGEKKAVKELKPGREYRLNGEVFERGSKRYIPIVQPQSIVVEENKVSNCVLKYYESYIEKKLDFDVIYQVISRWNDGFSSNIEIVNNEKFDIEPWELKFEFPQEQRVTSMWNGEFTQNDNIVSVVPNNWNQTIKAGESINIGFGATYNDENSDPEKYWLNGTEAEQRRGTIKVRALYDESINHDIISEVSIGTETKHIKAGEAVEFENLIVGKTYNINLVNCEGDEFRTTVAPSFLTVQDDNILESCIRFKRKDTKEIKKYKSDIDGIRHGNIVVHFESWREKYVEESKDSVLACKKINSPILLIEFAKPDMIYIERNMIRNTGLEFEYDGKMFNQILEDSRRRNPYVKVILSIGGRAYLNWESMNIDNVLRFVNDFNLDGIDLNIDCDDVNEEESKLHLINSIIDEINEKKDEKMFLMFTPFEENIIEEKNNIDKVVKLIRKKVDLINLVERNILNKGDIK